MADAATLRAALGQLDPANNDHWTTQGLPRMDVLAGIVGEQVDRRALNELVPGFNRAAAQKAKGDEHTQPAPTAASPASPQTVEDDLRRHSDATFKHMLARAERRKAALEHLAAGGFSVSDLQDTTSPLQRRVSSQNRQARREMS